MPSRRTALKVETTLAALGDPNRKAVVEFLAAEPRRAGDIADALSLSPQALSRHLRVLRRGGIIEHRRDSGHDDARVRVYQLRKQPFDHLRRWLDEVESFWVGQLSAFRDHIERKQTARSKSKQ